MNGFEVFLELVCWALDVLFTSADVYSWFRGRGNRVARRAAKTSGHVVPPRDVWNRRVLWLTVVVLLLTMGLL